MRWWPMRRRPMPVLDRSVESKTAAALASVDLALAELRVTLTDIVQDVVEPERGTEGHGNDT